MTHVAVDEMGHDRRKGKSMNYIYIDLKDINDQCAHLNDLAVDDKPSPCAYPLLIRLTVTNCLDIITVRIKYKGPIIVRPIFGSYSWLAFRFSSGRHR